MFGLTIGDKHTYDDFGLVMTKFYIPEPKVKVNKVDIPYASGSVDLSDVTGITNYEDRQGLSFDFVFKGSYEEFPAILQKLTMFLHGKKLHMIPDNDLGYYYVVRLEVDYDKTYKTWGTISLKGTADPFKYDKMLSGEAWLWDTFNFYTGIIRNYADIEVSDGDEFEITGAGVPTVPEFTVSESNNLEMSVNGRTYEMHNVGKYRFPSLKIGSEDTTLTFSGSGKITIQYRGRYL